MHGFTCATYVLSVFDYLGIELLDYADIASATRRRATPKALIGPHRHLWRNAQHLMATASEIPCLRFRPEEVAGACLSDDRPVPMPLAEKLAAEVERQMREYYIREKVN